jgi:hypothetical protein
MLRVLTVLALVVAVAGCKGTNPKDGEVRRITDEEKGVTCWIFVRSGAISCLRDDPTPPRPP